MARLSQDFQAPQIRSKCRARRCSCPRAALAGWRATYFSIRLMVTQRSCPRIVAFGDLDEDEIIFAEAATGKLAEDALAIAPAVGPLERRLMLAQLIANWADRVRSGERRTADRQHSGCAARARRRSRTADRRRYHPQDGLAKLDDLVPDRFDKYWQFTLEFLKIARSFWPERLNEIGEIDAADRRDQLIDAEMKPSRRQQCTRDRRRVDRFDARDGEAACGDCAASARRARAAGTGYRPR